MQEPVDQRGPWRIRLNASAQTINNQLEVTLAPSYLSTAAKDAASMMIRQQIVQLVERLHGRVLDANSAEISEYLQLFIDLRQNKINRKSGDKLTETGVRCDYNSNGVNWSVWAADPTSSLSAWRGLVTALMTDYHYLYE